MVVVAATAAKVCDFCRRGLGRPGGQVTVRQVRVGREGELAYQHSSAGAAPQFCHSSPSRH